ncbi:hypothetical protein ES702_03694 [subsurface metagenome]
MNLKINPKISVIYANLLRLGIGKYLISSKFKHLCIEKNLDEAWDRCKELVINERSTYIVSTNYTGYAEEALGIFLTNLLEAGKEFFLEILGGIIIDFAEGWDGEERYFARIGESLEEDLGYDIDEFVWLHKELVEIDKRLEKTIKYTKTKERPFLETKKLKVDKKLCFVLMPFDNRFDPIYGNIIKKVIKKFGLNCKRADEIFGTEPIIKDIWGHIQKARILIADITGRNANVFYELGLAHAINKEVILITQNIRDIPFDLQHYRCIVYEDSVAGGDKLKEGIEKTLKEIIV